MITPRRSLLLVATLAVLSACADDGNDRFVSSPTSVAPPVATTVATTTSPGGSRPPDATEPARVVEPTGVVVQVIALDNTFRPEVVEVRVGDEVVWENRGLNEHDLLYVRSGEWGVEAAEFQPGDVYRRVFTEPGEYEYYCTIHGTAEVGMIGTVVVTG